MANYADYVQQEGGIEQEIGDAQNQQAERERNPDNGQFVASTPETDWEQRYKELEKLNSRQAQTLGDYRKTIDEFIASPTPSSSESHEEPSPITVDDLYEDPNAAIFRAVDQHPDVQSARALKVNYEAQERARQAQAFMDKHPDCQDIGKSPEFQNWVVEDTTRSDLYQRSDNYDFAAADALFNWYKAEKGIQAATAQADIQQAELISSSGELVQEPAKYSRHEYINNLKRAKQGDLDAEDWVRQNAAGYRQALSSGNVRD